MHFKTISFRGNAFIHLEMLFFFFLSHNVANIYSGFALLIQHALGAKSIGLKCDCKYSKVRQELNLLTLHFNSKLDFFISSVCFLRGIFVPLLHRDPLMRNTGSPSHSPPSWLTTEWPCVPSLLASFLYSPRNPLLLISLQLDFFYSYYPPLLFYRTPSHLAGYV